MRLAKMVVFLGVLGCQLGMGCVGDNDASVSPVLGGRQLCEDGSVRARDDAGDDALCVIPQVDCNASSELKSVILCHYPAPAAIPASACCQALPAQCDPTDCECLLKDGPWLDPELAQDAGISLFKYAGPKRVCSGRVWCSPAKNGGAAMLYCNPA